VAPAAFHRDGKKKDFGACAFIKIHGKRRRKKFPAEREEEADQTFRSRNSKRYAKKEK
jgi:hypothetical protein